MTPLGSAPRILIVDDGVINVAEALHKLKAAGIKVDVAGDVVKFDHDSSTNPFEKMGSDTFALQRLRDPDPVQPEIEVRAPITYGPRHNVRKGKARRW